MRRWFVDRCLGSRVVPDALERFGVAIERHVAHFDDDVDDTEWIPQVARRGWGILTKDDRIRRNPVEREAVEQANAIYVALTSGNMTGPQMAECLIHHWRTIDGWIAEHAGRGRALIVTLNRSNVRWFDSKRGAWREISRKR